MRISILSKLWVSLIPYWAQTNTIHLVSQKNFSLLLQKNMVYPIHCLRKDLSPLSRIVPNYHRTNMDCMESEPEDFCKALLQTISHKMASLPVVRSMVRIFLQRVTTRLTLNTSKKTDKKDKMIKLPFSSFSSFLMCFIHVEINFVIFHFYKTALFLD